MGINVAREAESVQTKAVATVNHQGFVIAFARNSSSSGLRLSDSFESDIQFNVLALNDTSANDATQWTGFQPLWLPNEIRPAGMEIVNVPSRYSPSQPVFGVQDAGGPFRALSNGDYIYLFSQSTSGSVLATRLRLVRTPAPGNTAQVAFSLDPAWEVRFQKSGKPDTPADPRDVQNYVSLGNEPFIEPTWDPFCVSGVKVTDQGGGLVGSSFSLYTDSNFPMIDMSLPRLPIVQPGGGALQHHKLPGSYLADIQLNFWQTTETVGVDSWIELEIGYVLPDYEIPKDATRNQIDMVVLKKIRLMPSFNATEQIPVTWVLKS